MVKQRVQGLTIELKRWRFESGSANENRAPASKGHAAEQQRELDSRVPREAQSFGAVRGQAQRCVPGLKRCYSCRPPSWGPFLYHETVREQPGG